MDVLVGVMVFGLGFLCGYKLAYVNARINLEADLLTGSIEIEGRRYYVLEAGRIRDESRN